ncbi:MAG: xylose isomerase [Thermogutta sp.]|nr:MAG: xylose isomerase [Thermogutta sp.]
MACLSVSETTTFRWSFEEDVLRYKAAGIPAIGVWRQKLSDFGEEKGAELLSETGMRVSHLFWAGGFTGADGRTFKGAVEDALEAVRTAAELKTQCLLVYSGARGLHTHNHARRLFREALKEMIPLAQELGVFLGVEPMHPGCAADFTFITDLDDYFKLVDTLGSNQVKLIFDVYHLGAVPDIVSRIPQLIPHIALVQLGDAKSPPNGEVNRCLLGEGSLPLVELVRALRDNGYDGFFDVELIGEDVEAYSYDYLLEHAKSAYARLLGEGAGVP